MMNDIILTLPFWILGIGGVLLLLGEVFFRGRWSRAFFAGIYLVGAIAASINFSGLYHPTATVFSGLVAADTFALFTSVLFSLGTLLVVFMGYGKTSYEGIDSKSEFYALLLMSTAGAILFCNATELVTMFLGLEIMSMALYCLCGASIGRRESTEAGLKYFLLGSFSSAFLLYGIALMYGLTGTTVISEIAHIVPAMQTPTLLVALGLMLIGFAFKIGVVPFHFWAPDVYQGAPTTITAYMACVIKAASVAAAIRVIWTVFPELLPFWSGFVWMLAVLTIIAGNLIALRQRNVKRMLAYSSIAHAGYMMAAFLVPSTDFGGGAAILFYLVSYTAMTLGAFAVLVALQDSAEATPNYDVVSFNGLASRRPFLAATMSLFMLTLAGLPPGMAGLLGKFYVFSAAVKGGYTGLAIIGMLGSTVACYYYLRVIVAMYFLEPSGSVIGQKVKEDMLLQGVISVCGAACLIFGIFPEGLYSVAKVVADSLIR